MGYIYKITNVVNNKCYICVRLPVSVVVSNLKYLKIENFYFYYLFKTI